MPFSFVWFRKVSTISYWCSMQRKHFQTNNVDRKMFTNFAPAGCLLATFPGFPLRVSSLPWRKQNGCFALVRVCDARRKPLLVFRPNYATSHPVFNMKLKCYPFSGPPAKCGASLLLHPKQTPPSTPTPHCLYITTVQWHNFTIEMFYNRSIFTIERVI